MYVNLAGAFLYGVCIFSPCLCGLSLSTLASYHSQRHAVSGVKVIVDSKLLLSVSVLAL